MSADPIAARWPKSWARKLDEYRASEIRQRERVAAIAFHTMNDCPDVEAGRRCECAL